MNRFPPSNTVFINPHFKPPGATPSLFTRFKTALALQLPKDSNQSDSRTVYALPKRFSGFDLNKHPINQQLQSQIFKLPLEIRLLIYQQVIKTWAPGDGYHIVEASDLRYFAGYGLSFMPCDAPLARTNSQQGSGISHFHSWHVHDVPKISWREICNPPSTYGWATNRLAMSLSCRRIYSEFLDVLYSLMTFDLVGFDVAHRFLTMVAPQLLDKIQSLSLTSIQVPAFYTNQQVPEEIAKDSKKRNDFLKKHRRAESQWMEIGSRLSSMKNLKTLRIKIDNMSHMVLEGPLLRPLMAIDMARDSFMVELPYNFRVGNPHTSDIIGNNDKIPFQIGRGAPLKSGRNINVEARPGIWAVEWESAGISPAVPCKEYCTCIPQPNPQRQV